MAKAIQSWDFKVQGQGDFPTDMLRYDRCWPRVEGHPGGEILTPRHESRARLTREVVLTGLHEPTYGRWQSFGWEVIESKKGRKLEG